jgi:hypothetical protein
VSRTLDPLRRKILRSVEKGVEALQKEMVVQANIEVSTFSWQWKHEPPLRRTVDGSGAPYSIGTLKESLSVSKIKGSNSIGFSMKWDPISQREGKQFRYGSLVVTGHPNFFKGAANPEYSARPFTFLLMPKEQRDVRILKTSIAPDAKSLPETAWHIGMERFKIAFSSSMGMK